MLNVGEFFEFLGAMRFDLVSVYKTIENAADIDLDATKTNFEIKQDLQRVVDTHLPKTERFGVFIVEEHKNYRLPSFMDGSSEFGQVHNLVRRVDVYGLGEKLNDSTFAWQDRMLRWQDVTRSDCSCQVALDHNIIHKIAYRPDAYALGAISDIWSKVFSALDSSKDRERRAVIREQVLLAILEVNKELNRLTWEDL